MGSLQTLADKIKQNPNQADTFVDNYLSEFAIAPTLQNLQMILGQTDRGRKLVAEMGSEVTGEDTRLLSEAVRSFDHAHACLSILNEHLMEKHANATT